MRSSATNNVNLGFMVKILWVDDEVELLKPHIFFLQNKGYEVDTCNNGYDAIDMVRTASYDLIILDEMMPGMTGLETLPLIKDVRPTTPIIMVTKSEEENLMDKAIGSKIADYIIKPVNPNQVLLSIKKNVHSQQLVTEQTTADYRAEFGRISAMCQGADSFEAWSTLYRKITSWEIDLSSAADPSIREVLAYQKSEANQEFSKFVRRNYYNWINKRVNESEIPVLSHTLMRKKIFPIVDNCSKTTLLLIDNFRYDQWRAINSLLHGYYDVAVDDFYCAILPSATQYARNAIFAGLMPLAIDRMMPDKWLNDNEEGGKNQYEEEFLRRQLAMAGKNYRWTFDKLVRPEAGRKLIDNISRVYDAKSVDIIACGTLISLHLVCELLVLISGQIAIGINEENQEVLLTPFRQADRVALHVAELGILDRVRQSHHLRRSFRLLCICSINTRHSSANQKKNQFSHFVVILNIRINYRKISTKIENFSKLPTYHSAKSHFMGQKPSIPTLFAPRASSRKRSDLRPR